MAPLKLTLSKKDVEHIKHLLRYEEARVIRRANILNCLHLGYASGEIAQILNVDPKTVTNIGHAYEEGGLDAALFDDERSGRPIDIDDRERSRIVAMVCSDPPTGHYRWTLDLIAAEAGKRDLLESSISRETVRIILQEHDIKPWQEKMWCIGTLDTEYIRRMEDVLDVYARSFDAKKPVICLDEKPVPLIGDTRERLRPQGPGEVFKEGLRIRAQRLGECVLRGGAQSRALLQYSHRDALRCRVREVYQMSGRQIPRCRTHRAGHGQPLDPPGKTTDRLLR